MANDFMKYFEFDAEIKKHSDKDACFIEFPYIVKKEFGTDAQVKVIAKFDGHEYRGSLVKMGTSCHCLGISKEIRNIINKQASDIVHVVLTKDNLSRTIEIPDDFIKELDKNNIANVFFKRLSYTNQKEYVRWISTCKKSETRLKRVKESILMLSKGIKHP